jgi:hypothetical protein
MTKTSVLSDKNVPLLQLKTGKLGENVAICNLFFIIIYVEIGRYSSCCPFPTGGGNNNQKYNNKNICRAARFCGIAAKNRQIRRKCSI